MESDTPVSLTTDSGLFYTGENEYIIAVDGEITVTFDGEWGSDTEYIWVLLDGLKVDSSLKVDSTDRIVRSKHSVASRSEKYQGSIDPCF